MKPDEERVRNELDRLFKSAKTIEDLNNIEFLIDDYLDMGYNVRNYVVRYNSLVQELYSTFFPSNSE